MCLCLKVVLRRFYRRSGSKSPQVQPHTHINSSTHLSSPHHRSLKVEEASIRQEDTAEAIRAAIEDMYLSPRRRSLPVHSNNTILDHISEKHFSSLMLKRKTKDLISPESVQEYREVGGVLMLGKQIRPAQYHRRSSVR